LNIPNSITIARIALVPLIVFLLLLGAEGNTWQRWLALFLFILAISTDGLDGSIARRTNRVTNLGKILDPIADKALIGGLLLVLSYLGEIAWWITVVILTRELAVTLYRVLVAKRNVISASLSGKLKTIFQGIAIGVILAPIEIWFPPWIYFEQFMLVIAVLLTVVSGVRFFMAAGRK
jgi:CDP-diacylglycerol---glycerol-3-phosphate 3-phosphatidyltransferase